jgi:hypothetical protein
LDCWAVGESYNGSAVLTVTERWDGTSWAIVTSPDPLGSGRSILYGVTCVSASDCWAVGYFTSGGSHTLTEHYTVPPVQLDTVVSRKTHGSAGSFDVDLINGSGIECRSGGTSGDYTIVFSFANPLTSVAGANVARGNASVGSANVDGNDAHDYVVNLTGVTNAQIITVSLANVTDSVGNFSGAISASMAVLVGDTNGDGFVNSADIGQTKSQSGQPMTSSNFREDLNVDGFINSADISLVKSKSGTALP